MIRCEGFGLVYGDKQIFSNLSLEVKEGEKVLIRGGSGCGKSSFFRAILGFEPVFIGSVFFEGREMNRDNIWQMRQKIGYVDQDVSLPMLKVKEWFGLLFSFKVNRVVGFDVDYLYELMDFLELSRAILDKDIGSISGGERQRVGLISSLILKKRIFFLDEPTSFLERRLKEKTAGLFLKHNDYTILVASHDDVWLNGLRIFDMEDNRWQQ